MAETASVSNVGGAAITWASATYDWTTPDAGKSWAGAVQQAYTLSVASALGLGEALSNAVTKRLAESFATAEALKKSVVQGIAEALGFAETWSDTATFIVRVSENLNVGESLGNQTTLALADAFGITDDIARNIGCNIGEALTMADMFGRTVAFYLGVDEGFSTAEALRKAVTLSKGEALHLLDEYRRRGNAVLSDMIVSSADLALADFQEAIDAGHAPGYSPFRDFIQGDYRYRRAIFRAVLDSVNADRARISQLKVAVDVPDVFDRGTATITDAANGVRVTFARPFHIPPEITLTLKGGTVVAIPKEVAELTDPTGFTAVLVDPATNTNVTGSFSWAAHGY